MALEKNDCRPSQEAIQPGTASGEAPTLSAPRQEPVPFLLLAVWFGLLSGLGQVALVAVKKFFLHRYIHHGPDLIWMAPLADLLLFALLGIILSLIARRWPKLVPLSLAVTVFAFLGYLSMLKMYPKLHRYAALLLAAGLAVQTVRLVAGHTRGFYSLARRTIGWMLALVVGLMLGVQGLQALAERRALAKLPPAPPHTPNVLLIVLDAVRAQSLSLYGYARPTTPQLERLAKAGVRFERTIAASPWTLPSHGSMFTGRFPHELSATLRKPLDASYPTLAEVLSARGYLTAGFVANTFYTSRESGLGRGFTHYEDYRVSPGQIALSSFLSRAITNDGTLRRLVDNHQRLNRKDAVEVNREFLRWLSRKEGRPFFAFLNYYDAHEPYLPPKPFDMMFGAQGPRRNLRHQADENSRVRIWNMSPQEIQVELDAYEGSIAYLDHRLGLLFGELDKRGMLENTLVIITSDHGEEFGEHGVLWHGHSLYWPVLQVPLLIVFPSRVPAGKIVREPVTLRDLPATVTDLLRLGDEARFPGTSLARYWDDGRDPGSRVTAPLLSEVEGQSWKPKWYPVQKGGMKSLVVGRYHYIKNGDGREELYKFENDPWEKRDLAGSEEGRRALSQLRASLETVIARK